MLQLDAIAESLRLLLTPLRDLILAYVPAEWIMSLPAITLVIFGIIALAVGMKHNPLGISFIGVILAIFEMLMFDPSVMSGYSFGTLFIRDAFTDFFIWIVLIVALLVLMSSTLWGGDKGAYNFLLMISFAGALWVIMATDLVALFLAWEVMSTPTYILVALGPRREAIDGATKYFVMGLLATMLMLFGIALTFGVTGTTELSALSEIVNTLWAVPYGNESAIYTLLLAMVLFVVSFGFKVGIFPGWQWVPDAYASADGSVTAYLAGGSKKTGVSALLRILMVGFFFARMEWAPLIAGVAILTMIIGNVLALAQKDIMRMLAYSSVSMMGYLFIGVAAANEIGMAAAGFHAFTHAIMKTAAFILIWAMSFKLTKRITYDDLAGLSKRAPAAAAMFAILMLSLAGMPLTVGFWSKLVLFQSAVVAGMWWLALIGLLNSVFSLGYYLRVLKFTYMEEPKDDSKLDLPKVPMIAVAICVIAVIALFIFPNVILDYAFQAAALFFS
ncbi:MAG: NADH-quinone oxidoreductase subunit N [Candidatus Thorarchaeota archaeon]|nr:MAG: NADH-quinone oxidoreductase subunit N [Candidatus Thorarchaeota archaeon]